jgi:hypothetical protein
VTRLGRLPRPPVGRYSGCRLDQIADHAPIRYKTGMAEYLLIYDEAKRLQAEHPDDDTAICWARDEVPRLYGVPEVAADYPTAPMVLWRIEPTRREVIWESRSGMGAARGRIEWPRDPAR